MIPLIDVVFLLLVAFLFFAMSMTVYRGIPVDLPVSTAARVKDGTIFEITVEKSGTVFCDGEKVDIPILRECLTLLRRESPRVRIIVSGDREAPYESIIAVIDAVKGAGIAGLSLRTGLPHEGPGIASEHAARVPQVPE